MHSLELSLELSWSGICETCSDGTWLLRLMIFDCAFSLMLVAHFQAHIEAHVMLQETTSADAGSTCICHFASDDNVWTCASVGDCAPQDYTSWCGSLIK